jgi:phospholipase C
MQQNRTFDHYFGTYPGADGIPTDVCMPIDPFDSEADECVEPYYIGGGSVADLQHDRDIFWRQYNEGKMDGFVHALRERNQDGAMAMGYYDEHDLPYYWNLADEFVLFDRFFSSGHVGSVWNTMFWVAGRAGSDEQRVPSEGYGDIPTIFDSLEEEGISWKFYINNYDPELNYRTVKESPILHPQVQWVPLLSYDRFLDDPKLSGRIVDMDEFFEDLRNGTLPAVSYMLALGATEHPPARPEKGQRFVRKILQALIRSEAWSSSAFMLTYDDWGGWYDHVPPPKVDEYGYGFRVPALLVSPYAKRGYIDSTTLDFTSILKFIQENYDLEPLATRDAQANSIINAFDFTQPPRHAKFIPFSRDSGIIKPEPRRSMIYLAYGTAITFAMSMIAFPMVRSSLSPSRRKRMGAAK